MMEGWYYYWLIAFAGVSSSLTGWLAASIQINYRDTGRIRLWLYIPTHKWYLRQCSRCWRRALDQFWKKNWDKEIPERYYAQPAIWDTSTFEDPELEKFYKFLCDKCYYKKVNKALVGLNRL